jgi:predicted amidohydrolase
MRQDQHPSRRLALGLAAFGAAAGFAEGAFRPASAAIVGNRQPLQLRTDGTYPMVDLQKEVITLGVVQTRVRAVQIARLAATKKENLDHLLESIEAAQGWGGKKDILFFHEFPITGWSNAWNRSDALRAAIDIPGEETAAVGALARKHGCYIVFGSYAKDRDWANHLLSITTIIGPDGNIVDKHWKARNIKGVFGGAGFEIFTTAIHDVLDRYVEMYGRDAVIPVTRTPIGNIATSSVQREPELFRAYAMKGAELILRTATGGFTPEDIQATSMYNGVYTAVCNNAVSPDNPGFFEDSGGSGGSAIYDPQGKLIDEANSVMETIVTARIPIADFRRRHRQPVVHTSLYRDIYDAYSERYPANLFAGYLPTDGADAARYLRDKATWK